MTEEQVKEARELLYKKEDLMNVWENLHPAKIKSGTVKVEMSFEGLSSFLLKTDYLRDHFKLEVDMLSRAALTQLNDLVGDEVAKINEKLRELGVQVDGP